MSSSRRRFFARTGLVAIALAVSLGLSTFAQSGASASTPTMFAYGTAGTGGPAVAISLELTARPPVSMDAGSVAAAAPNDASARAVQQDLLDTAAESAGQMRDALRSMAKSNKIDDDETQANLSRMVQVTDVIANTPLIWDNVPGDLRTRGQDALNTLAVAVQKVQYEGPQMSPEQRRAALLSLAAAMDTLNKLAQQMSRSLPQPTDWQQRSMLQMVDQVKAQSMVVWNKQGSSAAVPQAS